MKLSSYLESGAAWRCRWQLQARVVMKARTRLWLGLLILGGLSLAPPRAAGYYDPAVQRWITRDPILEYGGVNLYGSVSNDPVNKADLFGLQGIGAFCRLSCEFGSRVPPIPRVPGLSYPPRGPFPPEGAIENGLRPGSWGRINPQTGKFEECWRFDKGDPSKPGWGGIDHFHYWGTPDHMLPPLPPFHWFTISPVNGPPTRVIAPPGVKLPPGFPRMPPRPLPPGTIEV
jgi:hypothetical protein